MATRRPPGLPHHLRRAASALSAWLAIVVMSALSPFVWRYACPALLPANVALVPLTQPRQVRRCHLHAPTGVLLIGALANAGGLAFRR